MKASEVAVLQVLIDQGGEDGAVPAPLSLLKDRTGAARSTCQLALSALAESGYVDVVAAPGRPNLYRVLSTGPITRPTTGPIHPPDHPPDRPDQTGPIDRPDPDLPSRAGAPNPLPPPSSPSRQPSVSRGRTQEGSDRPDDQTGPIGPVGGDVVEVGQAVVAWAVDEQRRLGKAPLDGALLGRIGSVAKRMIEGGVSAVDLKLAAETLVQRDMTDLQAAHRKAQSGGASPFAASLGEADPLAARAAASAASRAERIAAGEQQNESPHRPEEMVEVAWFIAYTWGQRYSDARLAAWSVELARLPVTVILHALRKIVRRGEHLRFPPTWGEVARIGEHDFDEWLWRSGQEVPPPPPDDPFADRPAPPWGGE